MKKIINYFLQGLLYIVPISATIFVVIYTLNKIADILPIKNSILSLVVFFALVTVIGMIGSRLIASPFNALFQKILDKAPLLKTIYSSIKDLMNTFSNHFAFQIAKNIGSPIRNQVSCIRIRTQRSSCYFLLISEQKQLYE